MCGLMGGWDKAHAEVGHESFLSMLRTLHRRGPDAEKFERFGEHFCGHRRLSVIDTTEASHQPMILSGDQGWELAMVFNGEIYNYMDLRETLQKRGVHFQTTGDAEVLLQAYRVWGIDAFDRLDGMFAVGIYDRVKNAWVLARDTVGKKPLYVYRDEARLLFASEPKAILKHPKVKSQLRSESIPEMLAFGYVPSPFTMHEGILQVDPGTLQVHDVQRSTVKVHSFGFHTLPAVRGRYWGGYEGAVELIRGRVKAAVKKRLVADVPLGAHLSGGIDSTVVVSVMAEHLSLFDTLTITYPEAPHLDESRFAKEVSERYGTRHHEIPLTQITTDDVEDMVRAYDAPFGDYAAVTLYQLSKATKRTITVALSGDGGDEGFGGYPRFSRVGWLSLLPKTTAFDAISSSMIPEKISRNIRQFGRDPEDQLRHWLTTCDADERALLYPHHGLSESDLKRAYERSVGTMPNSDVINRALWFNMRTYLLDDLIPKADRASMAAGLEIRSPFLDRALLQTLWEMPGSFKVSGNRRKKILLDAFRDKIPESILKRKKAGMALPVSDWFRTTLRLYAREAFHDKNFTSVIQANEVERLWNEHQSKQHDHGYKLWVLLTLAVWLRQRSMEENPA